MWFKHIYNILKGMNLNPCMSDPCVYVNASKDLIVAVYVDDILAFETKTVICTFKTSIKQKLNVRMLGTETQFLSVHLNKPNSTTVVLDQSVQIGQMLDLFDITYETGVSIPLAKECEDDFDVVCD